MITQQQALESNEAKEAEVVDIAEDEGSEKRAAEEAMARRISTMDRIGDTLDGHLAEAVQFRSSFERMWIEDIRQFEYGDAGEGAGATPTKQYSSDEEWKSVTDNVTRFSTITFAARLGDMLFPTNDRNWDMDKTPEPELPPEVMQNLESTLQMMASEGKISSEAMAERLEEMVLEVASKRMDKMRTKMDDQLTEARYADSGRELIMDGCKIGHGVMKGPFPKAKKRRRYKAGMGYAAVMEEVMTDPCVKRVDPWLVFPRPCRRIEDCPGVFELHELSSKRVSDLRMQPGFSELQVERLLQMAPTWASVSSTLVSMQQLEEATITGRNENYAVMEYHGQMPREAVDIFIEQLLSEQKISEEARAKIVSEIERRNSLHLNCNVWFSQGVVLKVSVSPVDYDHCMYKFFRFEENEASPFGKGIPRILRDTQRGITVLWRAIMLNAIMAAAPQIALAKGYLEPEGGGSSGPKNLRFDKPRVWSFIGEIDDIRKVFQVFTVPSTVGTTLPVYERAKQNAQEQTMLPLIAQGEPTQAVPTSSGLAMLMNASNIVQRRLAARFDAEITTPIIQSLYDWNMEFGPDEAKGDYKVVARASSHLLVKDIQAQHFMTALSLYASNPKLEPRMRWDAWAEEGMKILDMPASRFLLSEEEFEAAQAEAAKNATPDPETMKAEAAVKVADARVMEAQSGAEHKARSLELQAEDRGLDFEDRIADRESRERIAAMAVQQALAGLDADGQARVMELQAKMQSDADRNATQTRIAGMKAAEKAQEIAARERADQREVEAEQRRPEGPVLA
jgi:hypothetical protein